MLHLLYFAFVPAKTLHFPEKLYVCLQNICVLSQKHCIPLRNCDHSCKSIAFPKESLHSTKKHCVHSHKSIVSLRNFAFVPAKVLGSQRKVSLHLLVKHLGSFTKVLHFANKFHVPLRNFLFLLIKVMRSLPMRN